MRRGVVRSLSAVSIALSAALFLPLALTFLAPRPRYIDGDVGLIAMIVGIVLAPALAVVDTVAAVLAARRGESAGLAWTAAAIAAVTAVACFAAARAMRGHWA